MAMPVRIARPAVAATEFDKTLGAADGAHRAVVAVVVPAQVKR